MGVVGQSRDHMMYESLACVHLRDSSVAQTNTRRTCITDMETLARCLTLYSAKVIIVPRRIL